MLGAIQNLANPDDWELFALSLLQGRHGALHVQKIPAAHKGDYGIDYYCTKECVAYQCYAVEEPIDIATRAARQKKKITTDLAKMVLNYSEITKLFLGVPIKHWVLIAPLHDSKDVNLHCAKKTKDLREAGCAALDPTVEVLIQDTSAFPNDVVAMGMSALSKVILSIPSPSQTELDSWVGVIRSTGERHAEIKKASCSDQLEELVSEAIKSFLQGSALLDALRSGSPDLHEKVLSAIKSRARRLQFAGPQAGGEERFCMQSWIPSLQQC